MPVASATHTVQSPRPTSARCTDHIEFCLTLRDPLQLNVKLMLVPVGDLLQPSILGLKRDDACLVARCRWWCGTVSVYPRPFHHRTQTASRNWPHRSQATVVRKNLGEPSSIVIAAALSSTGTSPRPA